MNLIESLYNAATMYPDRECVRVKRDGLYQSLTYSEFWERVLCFAYGLKACGIQKGEKVAILANSCPEWAISDYAILAAGAVVVPIYPTVPGTQVEYILRNAEVSCLIVEDEMQLQKVMSIWPKTLRLVIMMRAECLEKRVLVEQFSHVLEIGREWLQEDKVASFAAGHQMERIDFRSIPEDTLATIVHTSGTSGQPKGVMLSHRNILSNVQACQMIFPIKPTDVSLSFLPLSHILERTVGQFTLLASGAAIVYAQGIDAIQENLQEAKPTVLITVPRLLEKVYAKVQAQIEQTPRLVRSVLRRGLGRRAGFTFRLVDWLVYRKLREGMGGRIRVIVSGGASLSPEIAMFYIRAGLPVHEGYGMTESSPVITANRFGKNRPGTVGQCIPGAEIRLAQDGELIVKGRNVMMGYYNAPEETGKVIEEGWLHTGDIAEIIDGYVRIIDRKKNILVLATGKNVAPGPIENAILASPFISTAVVIGDGRKYVTCLLVPNFGGLRDMAASIGLAPDPHEWHKHPAIRKLIASEVARTTESLAGFERPKRAVILEKEFSLETGELTPTLKVKNKIILEKFGTEIENMYNGTDYVPIFEEASSEHSSTPPSPPMSMSPDAESRLHMADTKSSDGKAMNVALYPEKDAPVRKRRYLVSGIPIAVTMLAALGIAFAKLPGKLNIPFEIHHIQTTNEKLGLVNRNIEQKMGNISQLADTTGKIESHLQVLNNGLGEERKTLTVLDQLSEQEITLSNQFYSLAGTMNQGMNQINEDSAIQSSSINHMVKLANQLASMSLQLQNINQSITDKLQSADEKTRTIASEMP